MQTKHTKGRSMGQIIVGIIGIGLFIGSIAGWVMNVAWLIGQEVVWNMEQVLSVLGVVMVPLGALMGWLH